MENVRRVLRPIEVARELGCCRKTVYAMLKANKIPYVKLGDMYAIPVAAFEKWLLECGKSRVAKCQQKERAGVVSDTAARLRQNERKTDTGC